MKKGKQSFQNLICTLPYLGDVLFSNVLLVPKKHTFFVTIKTEYYN